MEPERAMGDVESALRDFLRGRGLGRDERYLVAYSAGPDSCALLAAAAALSLPGLAAVFVDHGIRPAAEREAELALAKGICARLRVPLTVARVRAGAVELRAARLREGVEAAARSFRYRAIAEAMARRGATRALLAHTIDDQLETILMRFLSGAGPAGLRGIPPENGPFLRPFLGLRKVDLLGYVASRGLEYSTDSTNASAIYARNRVRLELVPLLDASFPGWRSGALLSSRKAALDEEALSRAADALAFAEARSDGRRGRRVAAGAEALLAAPRAIAGRAVIRGAGTVLGRARVSARLALAALDCLSRGVGYRGGGLEVRREGALVVISRSLDFPRPGGYFVVIDGPGRAHAGRLAVSAEWARPGGRGIRADAFAFPLVIRSRRPGDAIAIERGTKRIDELLPEMGLPPAERDRVPIVEDRAGIVAVLGSVFGARDRFRPGPSPGAGSEEAPRLSVIVKGA